MDKKEEIKKTLQELVSEVKIICGLFTEKKKPSALEFGTYYQNWYTKAIVLVRTLAPERLEEFTSYYDEPKRKEINKLTYSIQDFIRGMIPIRDAYGKEPWDYYNTTFARVYNQLQILQSLETRIESVLSDVQGTLLSEIQDRELETAEELLKINLRAAGSLAGVILENHLQKIVKNHRISVTKRNPNISDLNDLLKSNGVYDLVTWRNIQLLYDIRTKCAHKKDQEPTETEVRKLISGVNEVIKEIF
jgi:hypothetical protein